MCGWHTIDSVYAVYCVSNGGFIALWSTCPHAEWYYPLLLRPGFILNSWLVWSSTRCNQHARPCHNLQSAKFPSLFYPWVFFLNRVRGKVRPQAFRLRIMRSARDDSGLYNRDWFTHILAMRCYFKFRSLPSIRSVSLFISVYPH